MDDCLKEGVSYFCQAGQGESQTDLYKRFVTEKKIAADCVQLSEDLWQAPHDIIVNDGKEALKAKFDRKNPLKNW